MTAPDLKPCPFCGGDAQAVWQNEDTTAAYVDCMGCDARVLGVANRRDNIKVTDAAIAAWNTRAPLANQKGGDALADRNPGRSGIDTSPAVTSGAVISLAEALAVPTDVDREWIDTRADELFRENERCRGSIRPQTITPQDFRDYFVVNATLERFAALRAIGKRADE